MNAELKAAALTAPWFSDTEATYSLSDSQRFGGYPVFVGDPERPIAFVPHGDTEYTCELAKANARLIAAAPELLEALQKVKDWLDTRTVLDSGDIFLMGMFVNKAMAKATGGEL